MSRTNPSVSEIYHALEGGRPGEGEWENDVLANASPENRAKAQECFDRSEGSNR